MFKLLDTVFLVHEVRTAELKAGDLGTIVQVLEPEV